jgi:hypothetical protein
VKIGQFWKEVSRIEKMPGREYVTSIKRGSNLENVFQVDGLKDHLEEPNVKEEEQKIQY